MKPTTRTRATASRAQQGASAKKRAREPDAIVAEEGPAKRQKSSAALLEAQTAAVRSVPSALPRPQSSTQQRPASTLPLNRRPAQHLNVYVMGANSGGELGLGPSVKSGNVGRPRLNPYLSGTAGVVQVSLGAMHGVALTLDNRILTWGVNDHGALGRDTSWEGGLVDADANGGDSDSDDEGELNPKESTPTSVDMSAVPPGTVFTQVAAADNATFALTNTGRVYGWGAFRVSHRFSSIISSIVR